MFVEEKRNRVIKR